MRTKSRQEVAVIVPAFNEELVISKTLESLLKVIDKKHIYVVDDCSNDKTSLIAKKYTKNVYRLRKNAGKANALNKSIEHFKLIQKYKYLMPIDADSEIDAKFFERTLPKFNKSRNVSAVIGKIKGRPINWITAYRCWEYEIGQEIHKRAQTYAKMVSVCPGPSTIFRSTVFNKVKYSTDTKTEDMDLTFAMHRKRIGNIEFAPTAIVYTQDPQTLKQFIKQIDRWYTGYWQCVVKHNVPWQGQSLDLDVGLMAVEGLFNGVLVFMGVLFLPMLARFGLEVLLLPILIDLVVFILPSILLTVVRYRSLVFFVYLPHFYIMRIVTSLVFLRAFFKVVFFQDRKLGWNKVNRYIINQNGK